MRTPPYQICDCKAKNWSKWVSLCAPKPVYSTYLCLGELLMSLHSASNVVVRLYCSFQLRPLAVARQSVKLKSANFLKFRNRVFCAFGAPCSIMPICCGPAFSAGLHCL